MFLDRGCLVVNKLTTPAPKPFFNNRGVSDQRNLREFKTLVWSQLTYGLPIWSCVLSSIETSRIEQTFICTLRGAIQIPYWWRNGKILKGLNIPTISKIAPKLACNLHSLVVTNINTSICHLRPRHLLELR